MGFSLNTSSLSSLGASAPASPVNPFSLGLAFQNRPLEYTGASKSIGSNGVASQMSGFDGIKPFSSMLSKIEDFSKSQTPMTALTKGVSIGEDIISAIIALCMEG